MQIRVPLGKTQRCLDIPEAFAVDIISPPDVPPAADPQGEVRFALDHLSGQINWSRFQASQSVGIAINDKSRPVPLGVLLPPLLECLRAVGVQDQAITFYIAVGSHPPMTPVEFSDLLPPAILQRYRVISHNAYDRGSLRCLGETIRGTPVYANTGFTQAEHRIVIGNIEPHQFAGFSGGVKTAAIGLAGKVTISRNHAMMTHPEARLGAYETNPVRMDIEEIGKMMSIDLALNAILNTDKQIVRVIAGEPVNVMQEGVPVSRKICQVPVPQRYNLVIASPGGFPKDINVYQAQKALAHASMVTNPGGTIILVAACSEGSGSPSYEAFMKGKISYQEVIDQFRAQEFEIGPHKAYQVARDASTINLMVYSDLAEDLAQALLLNPIKDLQTEVNVILRGYPASERIAYLPFASSTIPHTGNE